jgi:uncharacterized protein YndB with AHSA1/START domain
LDLQKLILKLSLHHSGRNAMEKPTTTHDTFVLERTYDAAPERVFAALSDPAKKRRWFAEGHQSETLAYELDFRVGGAERLSFRITTGPAAGAVFDAHGVHLDIVENQRVVIAATMATGEKVISAALATFELLPAGAGTKLVFTHQGAFFEGADGPQLRQAGWVALLDALSKALA